MMDTAESTHDNDGAALLQDDDRVAASPSITLGTAGQQPTRLTVNGTTTYALSKPRFLLNNKVKPANSNPDMAYTQNLLDGESMGSSIPSRVDRARLTIRTKLRFMTATTSFDGLKFMYGTPRTIIWIIIFILSMTAMAWVLWSITAVYLARNTTFSRARYFPPTMNFPAITICNHNPYYNISVFSNDFHSVSNETQVAIYYEFYRKDRLINVNTLRLLEFINDSFSFEIFAEPFDHSVTLETVLRQYGHKLEHGLLSCYFDGRECGINDFIEVVTSYGLCYTFNLDGTWNISNAGTSHGLSLLINIEQLRYMYYTSHTAGLQVFVHPQDEYPYSGEVGGFSVPPGFETQVAISLTNTKLLDPPYGQCGNRPIHDPYIYPCTVTNSNSTDSVMESMMKCPQSITRYTRQRCLDECEALYQNRRCGCKADYLPGADIRVCNLNELFSCLLNATDQFTMIKNSLCDCPVECDRVHYATKLSRSYFPAYRYPLVSDVPQQFIRSNFLSLLFYFDQLEYSESTEEVDFDTFRYLADFGSHLGLFTGAGVLSFFEIFEICLY